jgi:hypothetical protein
MNSENNILIYLMAITLIIGIIINIREVLKEDDYTPKE